jgi:hypothetical protein
MNVSALNNNLFVKSQNLNSHPATKQSAFASNNLDVVSFSGKPPLDLKELEAIGKIMHDKQERSYSFVMALLERIEKVSQCELSKENKKLVTEYTDRISQSITILNLRIAVNANISRIFAGETSLLPGEGMRSEELMQRICENLGVHQQK